MGVLELKIIECGNTSLDYELALSGHPDRIATRAQPSRSVEILRHPIYTYVVEHTDGRVLVDTAVSVNYQREWRDRSLGARSFAWAELAAFWEAGLFRPRYGVRTCPPAPV